MPCFTIDERLRRLLAKRQKELDRKTVPAPETKPEYDIRICIGTRVRRNAAYFKSRNDVGTVINEYDDICFVKWDSDRSDAKGAPFYKKYLEIADE